ncbi:MAG: glycosyltransferase family 2 protein [Prevotellaceae bacterium]|jgi:GT2 family glycosyltransferase|nr:glycosyltransferase family 2 protein [Prevotellaceae bacterium]
MNSVFIIILNYNGDKDTVACIDSLLNITYSPITVCVIDNGSERDSVDALNRYFDEIRPRFASFQTSQTAPIEKDKQNLIAVFNDDNLGFAAGNNVGARMALQAGFEYVLLLNNDTLVEPDFLEKLMTFCVSHPHYVAVTPKICLESPRNIIWNCGGKLTWFKNRKYYYPSSDVRKTPHTGFSDVSIITGCALLFKPKETGLLTEDFFFGEEDFEFSLRMKRQKKKMACVYDAVIYHKVGSTVNKTYPNTTGKLKLFYINRFIDIKNYYPKTWRLWVFINSTYAFFMIRLRYKVTLKRNLKLWFDVYREVKTKTDVSKEYFMHYMKTK